MPIQDLITDALQHSPDMAQSRIDLTNRDITNKATRNELLPTVDLVAWYGSSALAGNPNAAAICPPLGSPPGSFPPAPVTAPAVSPTLFPICSAITTPTMRSG